MTSTHTLSIDEGLIKITIGDVTQELDLFRTNNALLELLRKHGDKTATNACFEALAEYLTELGFPPVSYAVVTQFLNLVFREAHRLGEKLATEPTPASVASTQG